jgi:hypothetical protein
MTEAERQRVDKLWQAVHDAHQLAIPLRDKTRDSKVHQILSEVTRNLLISQDKLASLT